MGKETENLGRVLRPKANAMETKEENERSRTPTERAREKMANQGRIKRKAKAKTRTHLGARRTVCKQPFRRTRTAHPPTPRNPNPMPKDPQLATHVPAQTDPDMDVDDLLKVRLSQPYTSDSLPTSGLALHWGSDRESDPLLNGPPLNPSKQIA